VLRDLVLRRQRIPGRTVSRLVFNFCLGLEGAVSVSDYLERARECAAMAETMGPEEKKKLLDIAEAWLKLADDAAKKEAAKQNGRPPREAR